MSSLGVGVDEAWDRASAADLVAYGASFCCRYVGEDQSGKNLTAAEAAALSMAGIWIVTNYEYNPGAALKGFAEGQRVARLADAQHRACGGPDDRPIYFSVDFDASGTFAAIGAYFEGIASVIGIGRTGVYGEYDVVRYLWETRRVRWIWQTYAWSHGLWYPQAHIRQVANGVHVAGHDVDRDESQMIDFGQWRAGMTTLDEGFPSAGGKVTRTLVTDIREAASILLDGVTIGGDAPAGLYGVVRRVVREELAARPQTAVDATTLAGAMVRDPAFADALTAALSRLGFRVVPPNG
jgi:hypothetical protein